MANETKFFYGTQATIANANGPATSSAQLSASVGSYSTTQTSDYPDAVFMLKVASSSPFGGTPTAGSTLDLYVVPQQVDGSTGDQVAPATGASTDAYKGIYVCSFVLKASNTGSDMYVAFGYGLPKEGTFYLYNGSGQSLAVNWSLYMTPRTLGPA